MSSYTYTQLNIVYEMKYILRHRFYLIKFDFFKENKFTLKYNERCSETAVMLNKNLLTTECSNICESKLCIVQRLFERGQHKHLLFFCSKNNEIHVIELINRNCMLPTIVVQAKHTFYSIWVEWQYIIKNTGYYYIISSSIIIDYNVIFQIAWWFWLFENDINNWFKYFSISIGYYLLSFTKWHLAVSPYMKLTRWTLHISSNLNNSYIRLTMNCSCVVLKLIESHNAYFTTLICN